MLEIQILMDREQKLSQELKADEEETHRRYEHKPQKADLQAIIDQKFIASNGTAREGLYRILGEYLIPEHADDSMDREDASIARIVYTTVQRLSKAVDELFVSTYVDKEVFNRFLSSVEGEISIVIMKYTFPVGINRSDVNHAVNEYVKQIMQENYQQLIHPTPLRIHCTQNIQDQNDGTKSTKPSP